MFSSRTNAIVVEISRPSLVASKSGVKVLSVYQKTSNKETTEIIKDLKRGTPERGVSVQEDDYNSFLTRTAIFYGRVLKDMDIDTIFTMESKSSLSKDLTSKIKTILPKISETEIIALKSGGVSIDRELFQGKVDYSKLFTPLPI